MPIEIGELVINARVVSEQRRGASAINDAPTDNKQTELIERCVAEVLRILDDKRER